MAPPGLGGFGPSRLLAGCLPCSHLAQHHPGTLRLLSPEPRRGQERLEGSARSPSPTHPKPRSQAGGLVGVVDTAWGSPFSPLGRRVPAAQGSAQNRHAEGAVEGPATLQAPSGRPTLPRPECQLLCPAEVPQESGHHCQGLVAGTPWGSCQRVSSAPAPRRPAAPGAGVLPLGPSPPLPSTPSS